MDAPFGDEDDHALAVVDAFLHLLLHVAFHLLLKIGMH